MEGFIVGFGAAVLLGCVVASLSSSDPTPTHRNYVIPASEYCMPYGWRGKVEHTEAKVYTDSSSKTHDEFTRTTIKFDVGQDRHIVCIFDKEDLSKQLSTGDMVEADRTGERIL